MIEKPNQVPICIHATDSSITITSNTSIGGRPTFDTKIERGNRKFVSISLYTENWNKIPVKPYKGMATEFFRRSIYYLGRVSPHEVITGMIGRWKPQERNHDEFFEVYDPKKDNYIEAALHTYTGKVASTQLEFNIISRIPGHENRIPREDEELSIIFSK